MDLFKHLLLYIKIFLLINREFIRIHLDKNWEDMRLKLWDGEFRIKFLIGLLLILGIKAGVIKDFLKSKEVTINVEFKVRFMLGFH